MWNKLPTLLPFLGGGAKVDPAQAGPEPRKAAASGVTANAWSRRHLSSGRMPRPKGVVSAEPLTADECGFEFLPEATPKLTPGRAPGEALDEAKKRELIRRVEEATMTE